MPQMFFGFGQGCSKSCDGGITWRHRTLKQKANECGLPATGENWMVGMAERGGTGGWQGEMKLWEGSEDELEKGVMIGGFYKAVGEGFFCGMSGLLPTKTLGNVEGWQWSMRPAIVAFPARRMWIVRLGHRWFKCPGWTCHIQQKESQGQIKSSADWWNLMY